MENEETEATTIEKTIDPGKYQTVLRGRREALSRVAELEDQIRDLQARAGTAEQLQAQIAEMQQGTAKMRDEYESERGLWRAGLTDPEGIEIARLLHGRLPAEGRPTLSDWLAGFASDASTAPRALAGYLPGSSASAAAPAAPASVPSSLSQPVSAAAAALPAPGLPNTNRGTVPGASAPVQTFDAASIRAMREDAQRSGDYSRLREAMPAIKKSIAG